MFRVKLIMIGIGGVLMFVGFQEFRVSQGTSTKAELLDLSAVEAGEKPGNSHVKIGGHTAVHGGAIYEYRQSKYSNADPTPKTKITHAYYPIISKEHPFNVGWAELAQKYASLDEIPEGEKLPELTTFSVIVKTKRFETIGNIPDGINDEKSVQGLLINRIEGLDSEERNLILQSFPQVDVDQLLLLEEGRKPSSNFKSIGTMGGGLLLALVGIGLFFVGGSES